jgi:hypothetical protein
LRAACFILRVLVRCPLDGFLVVVLMVVLVVTLSVSVAMVLLLSFVLYQNFKQVMLFMLGMTRAMRFFLNPGYYGIAFPFARENKHIQL